MMESKLDWPDDLGISGRRFRTALFIGDPKDWTGDPFANLGQLYGLTPAESRLAWLLVGDRTLSEAAAQLGIKLSTARTVLKRVLAKTDTRRQASLVRLLLSGPAQLRSDSRGGAATEVRRRPRARAAEPPPPRMGGSVPRLGDASRGARGVETGVLPRPEGHPMPEVDRRAFRSWICCTTPRGIPGRGSSFSTPCATRSHPTR